MLTNPKNKLPIQTKCICQNPKLYTHTDGKVYCGQYGYEHDDRRR